MSEAVNDNILKYEAKKNAKESLSRIEQCVEFLARYNAIPVKDEVWILENVNTIRESLKEL